MECVVPTHPSYSLTPTFQIHLPNCRITPCIAGPVSARCIARSVERVEDPVSGRWLHDSLFHMHLTYRPLNSLTQRPELIYHDIETISLFKKNGWCDIRNVERSHADGSRLELLPLLRCN